MRERVIVAMSGGVDSGVAAARLMDDGFDVVGVTLHLWDYPEREGATHGRCCAPEDQYDARRTADALGFPHFTFDRRALFAETVVEPFVKAYLSGETPSPCTACNRGVKLQELFGIADRLGARFVATGHYARSAVCEDGHRYVAQGRDVTKDQSYFLYATPEHQLARMLFPVGESTKLEVRAEALTRGLPGATKGESQELCFVGDRAHAYVGFVEARAGGRLRPGPIVDAEGKRVGRHDGVHRFTIGQRKGVGVSGPRPRYVTGIDSSTGEVRLGEEEELLTRSAAIEEAFVPGHVSLPRRARIRVRYRHEGVEGDVRPDSADAQPRRLIVTFDEPVRAVTRGQVAVFYEGDRVVGGGIIGAVKSPEWRRPVVVSGA